MLSKSVGDLHNSPDIAGVAPFYAGDGKIVIPLEFESLRLAHFDLYI